MKTKHDIQLELLGELDAICMENNLKYILFGTNSLNAYNNHTIEKGSKMTSVAMTTGDIERFCKIIERKHGKNRYVEGIFNNPFYIPFHVAYGDKNTTDLNIVKYDKNRHHGINIRLYPICKYASKKGKKLTVWDDELSEERQFRQDLIDPLEYDDSFKQRVMNRFHPFTGNGKSYYENYKKYNAIDRWEDIQKFSKVRISQKIINTKLLKGIERFDVDGISLCLPSDADKFFRKLYGQNFKNKKIKHQKQSMREIVDTEVGYRKIMKENRNLLNEAQSTYREIEISKSEVENEKEVVANIWRLVQMTDKEIEYRHHFEDRCDELLAKDLDDEQQLNEVHAELKPVISTLNKYSKHDLTFSISPEMDGLIEDVLLRKKKKKLLKKIKKLSQKEYLIE